MVHAGTWSDDSLLFSLVMFPSATGRCYERYILRIESVEALDAVVGR